MTAWMSSMSSSYLATSSGALSAQYSLYQCGYGRFRNMSTYTFHLGGLRTQDLSSGEVMPFAVSGAHGQKHSMKLPRMLQHTQGLSGGFNVQLNQQCVAWLPLCAPVGGHLHPDVLQLHPRACSRQMPGTVSSRLNVHRTEVCTAAELLP